MYSGPGYILVSKKSRLCIYPVLENSLQPNHSFFAHIHTGERARVRVLTIDRMKCGERSSLALKALDSDLSHSDARSSAVLQINYYPQRVLEE